MEQRAANRGWIGYRFIGRVKVVTAHTGIASAAAAVNEPRKEMRGREKGIYLKRAFSRGVKREKKPNRAQPHGSTFGSKLLFLSLFPFAIFLKTKSTFDSRSTQTFHGNFVWMRHRRRNTAGAGCKYFALTHAREKEREKETILERVISTSISIVIPVYLSFRRTESE